MPTSAGKRGKRAKISEDPEKEYKRLSVVKKLIVYNYWEYYDTNTSAGWDSERPGSVFHYRQSKYIESCGSPSWFRNICKVSYLCNSVVNNSQLTHCDI